LKGHSWNTCITTNLEITMLDLLKKLGSTVGLASPPPPKFQVPVAMPALSAKNGADLARQGGFGLAPGSPDPREMTPSQFLDTALNERQEAMPATRALAKTLPEEKRLQWAVDSCGKVEGKMAPADRDAFGAAKAFMASPTSAARSAADGAATQAGFTGPGAFVAKAASLSTLGQDPTIAAPAPIGAVVPDPVGECVAGAVVLAALLGAGKLPAASQPGGPTPAAVPAKGVSVPSVSALDAGSPEANELANALKPFLEDGMKRAAV